MRKTFFKNLTRDVKKTLSRFLSIVIIIAIGVSFYAGIRATSPDMQMSGDDYFSKNNLMDFKLISTLGLTEDDIKEVEKQEGITKVEGSYSIDAVIEKNKRLLVLNISSQPGENSINSLRMVRGRKANSDNEAVVEEKFLIANKLKLNDKIVIKSGNESNIQDNLKNNEFEIVGTAGSPLYISEQRQLSSVGNGSVKGFVYILPSVFKNDVYTEIYVRTKSIESENSLLDNESYINANKSIEKALKDLGASRGEIRYAGVLKEGNDKLNQAVAELNASKKEAADKFAKGYSELKVAQNKINEGTYELAKNQTAFNNKMTDGKRQIEDGKAKIASGEAELNANHVDIEKGKSEIAEGKNKLNDSEKNLNLGKQKAVSDISSSIYQELSKAKEQLDSDPDNIIYMAQYNFLNETYEKYIKGRDFDSMYSSLKSDNKIEDMQAYFDMEALKSNFDKAASDISSARLQLSNNEKSLQEGETKINAGRAELVVNKQKIANSEIELNKGRLEGLDMLAKARKDLEEGQIEVNKNIQILKVEEEKANTKIKNGETEIEKNRNKLEDIKVPDWYVLGRSANIGYETYRQDSDRINNIGKSFPLIFFLVAALVSLTTMTRMVQEKRIEIGTFKALGYSRAAIVSHYLIYALSASLIGSFIGVSIGFRLFPPLIMKAYGSLYAIPRALAPFNNGLALQASLIAILFTAVAAVAATLEELREEPASLMRPKPPKSGKVILLERVTFIWKRLNFTSKVTARNIFRYKQRLFMTVIGVAACTGLLVTGFGLKEGIIGATERQFSSIYKYDMQGTLTKNVREAEKNSIKEKIIKDTNLKSVLFTYSKNGTVKIDNDISHDVFIVVPEDKGALSTYINLTKNDKELNLEDDGVIITEKLSKIINKKIGDTIIINLNDKQLEVKISDITEQYIQHYIYISPVYYQKITGSKLIFNSFYGLIVNISESYENRTSNTLKSIKGINSIGFKNNLHVDMNKTIDSINSVVLVLIVAAGVLAFVVIFNLTNINISERKRELATIKLLGFYNDELAKYIYRENIILTIIGSLTGILVGVILNNYVIAAAETDIIMFLRKISPIYFVYSVLLTMLFSVIVNLAMYSRFDKIDMIESLKSAE
jgi:putative ABC transport system permease protein